ncbi:phosphorylase family protein [Paenibacillus sp. GYB003]|uniref:phosphorylase family protein n=1 Tax=Paenibacillus sp. GYB003 TaxID=2994392 RepID=UPI002F96423B
MSIPSQHRYISPSVVMKNRFRQHPAPDWKLAVICFRDYKGSQLLVRTFGAEPVGYKVLYGMEEFEGSPVVYEADIAGSKVGIVTRCNWGGPQAAILVEELAELGVERIVGFGAAGSIVGRIGKGTQLIASRALLTDGTSRAYIRDETSLDCDPSWTAIAKETAAAAEADGETVRFAAAANVDALYRETRGLIEELREAGAEIVNMETAALYAAARVCGVKSVWVGFASDCLDGDEWDDWHIDLLKPAEATARLCLDLCERALAAASAGETG